MACGKRAVVLMQPTHFKEVINDSQLNQNDYDLHLRPFKNLFLPKCDFYFFYMCNNYTWTVRKNYN